MSQKKKMKSEHSMVFFESASHVYKHTAKGNKVPEDSITVFPENDGQAFYHWYVDYVGSDISIVLKSGPSAVETVEAEYVLKASSACVGHHPWEASKSGVHKFKVEEPKRLIKLYCYKCPYSDEPKDITVEVSLKARVEEKKSGPNCMMLSPFLDSKKFSDVRIEVGKKFIPAHRIVLATHSPVFAAMFESEMKEKAEKRVKIVDFKAGVVEAMISFMYTGKMPSMTYNTAVDLLGIADKYAIRGLKDLCISYLIELVDDVTVADIIVLANTYGIDTLKKNAMNYFCDNVNKLGSHLHDIVSAIKSNCPDAMEEVVVALANELAAYQRQTI